MTLGLSLKINILSSQIYIRKLQIKRIQSFQLNNAKFYQISNCIKCRIVWISDYIKYQIVTNIRLYPISDCKKHTYQISDFIKYPIVWNIVNNIRSFQISDQRLHLLTICMQISVRSKNLFIINPIILVVEKKS